MILVFEILYIFAPRGETYTQIFFTDGVDNIYKTNVNSKIFLKMITSDKLQAYLRKRYDYHTNSVFKVDDVEIKGLYRHFDSIKDEYNKNRIFSIMRNRKIDDVLG